MEVFCVNMNCIICTTINKVDNLFKCPAKGGKRSVVSLTNQLMNHCTSFMCYSWHSGHLRQWSTYPVDISQQLGVLLWSEIVKNMDYSNVRANLRDYVDKTHVQLNFWHQSSGRKYSKFRYSSVLGKLDDFVSGISIFINVTWNTRCGGSIRDVISLRRGKNKCQWPRLNF